MAALFKVGDYELGQDNNIFITGHNLGITPNMSVNAVEVANREGSEVVESRFGEKKIVINGLIYGEDKSTFEGAVADFKKAIVVKNEWFYFTFSGMTLKYKVYMTGFDWKETLSNDLVREFTIEYSAFDPPFAQEDATTTAKEIDAITSQIYEDNVSFDGTSEPKPKIKVTFDDADSLTGIELINSTNGSRIEVTTSFATGDVLIIDTDTMEVTLNGEPIAYTGVLPSFEIGSNNLIVNSYTDSGVTKDQSNAEWNKNYVIYGDYRVAQSFQVSGNGVVPRIDLIVQKVGSPTGDLTVSIETDNSGVPSGSAVTDGTTTISADDIKENPVWVNALFENFPSLSTATTYHIVVYTSGGDEENYYRVMYNRTSVYASGQVSRSVNAGSNWTEQSAYDLAFKVFLSSVDAQQQSSIVQATEDFSADTKKDSEETTANWDTSAGKLKLVLNSNQVSQQQTTVNGTEAGTDVTCSNTPPAYNYAAQSFKEPAPCQLKKATIKIFASTGGDKGFDYAALNGYTVYAEICSDNAGVPGTTLGTASVATNGLPHSVSGCDWVDFTFSTPVSLAANTTYWIKLYSNAPISLGGGVLYSILIAGSNADTYANGVLKRFPYGGSWQNASWADAAFKTTVDYYDSSNVGQSTDEAAPSFGIVSANISKTDSLPTGSSMAYQLSNDGGSNFESFTPGTEKLFTLLSKSNKNLRFSVALSRGSTFDTPYLDDITLNYKMAGMLQATNDRCRQSFKPGFSGELGRIELYMLKAGTPGDLTVELYADSAGNPTGSALASQVVSASNVSATSPNWIAVNFDTPYSVTSGTKYHIVVKGASLSTSNFYMWFIKSGDPYATDGDAGTSTDAGSNWTTATGYDFTFTTYAASLTFSLAALITYIRRWLL